MAQWKVYNHELWFASVWQPMKFKWKHGFCTTFSFWIIISECDNFEMICGDSFIFRQCMTDTVLRDYHYVDTW